MAIIDTTAYKNYAGISATTWDTQIALMATAADRRIKAYLGYDIESGTYPGTVTGGKGDSGYYSGNGTPYLLLRNLPVLTITSVYQDATGRFGENPDGAFASATLLVEGTDYVLRTDGYIGSAAVSFGGILERIGSVWPELYRHTYGQITGHPGKHRGNIKVAYTAGYATVPGDIALAAAMLISHWRRNIKKGGPVVSENLGSYSYSLGEVQFGSMPPDVVDALKSYKIPRFG
jgi:hypothetical protein